VWNRSRSAGACAAWRSVFFINNNDRIPYFDILYSLFDIHYSLFQSFLSIKLAAFATSGRTDPSVAQNLTPDTINYSQHVVKEILEALMTKIWSKRIDHE